MGNILSIFQEIFTGKTDNCTKIGLSALKEPNLSVSKPQSQKSKPKELKISDLMRKGTC